MVNAESMDKVASRAALFNLFFKKYLLSPFPQSDLENCKPLT